MIINLKDSISSAHDYAFGNKTIVNVQARQYDRHIYGFTCAKCGIHSAESIPVDWFYIPRIPIKQGGTRANNCVLVCSVCHAELEQDGTKTIPYSEFPFWGI